MHESKLTNDALRKKWWSREALMEETRKRTGENILLAFSRGKDSIAAWIALQESGLFKNIIPVYLYLVPDLKFEEESLKYFEDVFQTHIYRLPHPSFYQMMYNNIFQPPGRLWAVFDFFRFLQVDYTTQNNCLKKSLGLPKNTLQANGVRACDTMVRRMALRDHGPFGPDNVKIIWDWSTREVKDTIARRKIKLPVDYEMFGRSFDGIGYQYAKPIKERFPEDYETMLKWFPLLELDIQRVDSLPENERPFIKKNGRYVVNYEA